MKKKNVFLEEPKQIQAIGKAFYDSAKILGFFAGEFYDLDTINDEEINEKIQIKFALPKIVLQALSAEIALKSFGLKDGEVFQGHDLYDLYQNLDIEIQEKIRTKTKENINLLYPERKYNEQAFEIHLMENSKIFIEWRYIYEKDGYELDYEFFDAFVKSLYQL